MKTPSRGLASVGAAVALVLAGGAIALAGPGAPDEPEDDGQEPVVQVEDTDEIESEQANEDAGDNATAFSEWVRELPRLGCIRGQLVAHAARGDHRGDDFAPPAFESDEEALEELGLTDRRCAEVALEKAAADAQEGDESEGEAGEQDESALEEQDGHGNGHGKPDHAKGPKDKGDESSDDGDTGDDEETSDDG